MDTRGRRWRSQLRATSEQARAWSRCQATLSSCAVGLLGLELAGTGVLLSHAEPVPVAPAAAGGGGGLAVFTLDSPLDSPLLCRRQRARPARVCGSRDERRRHLHVSRAVRAGDEWRSDSNEGARARLACPVHRLGMPRHRSAGRGEAVHGMRCGRVRDEPLGRRRCAASRGDRRGAGRRGRKGARPGGRRGLVVGCGAPARARSHDASPGRAC